MCDYVGNKTLKLMQQVSLSADLHTLKLESRTITLARSPFMLSWNKWTYGELGCDSSHLTLTLENTKKIKI